MTNEPEKMIPMFTAGAGDTVWCHVDDRPNLDNVYEGKIEWRGTAIFAPRKHLPDYYGNVDLVDEEPSDSIQWPKQRDIIEIGTSIPKRLFNPDTSERCEYCDTKHSAEDKRCSFCGGKL